MISGTAYPRTAIAAEKDRELSVSAPQCTGDIERVSGMCSGATKGAAQGSRTDEEDIGEDQILRGFGGIASGQGDVVVTGQRSHSIEEFGDPVSAADGLEQLRGKRQ
jgi:hypothetical protein